MSTEKKPDNDNMGTFGAALFAALKPPTKEEIARFMGEKNAETK